MVFMQKEVTESNYLLLTNIKTMGHEVENS